MQASVDNATSSLLCIAQLKYRTDKNAAGGNARWCSRTRQPPRWGNVL